MAMARGQAVSEGFVNFPFNDPEYPERAGMGLVVKLIVIDAIESDGADAYESLGKCTGVSVFDVLQEILVGDDQRPVPCDDDPDYSEMPPEQIMARMDADQLAHQEWVRFHFPLYETPDAGILYSRHYRASVVLGSTGWAGFSLKKGNWHATFADLNPDGQALYRMMEKLNPGCPIHILTFLDT